MPVNFARSRPRLLNESKAFCGVLTGIKSSAWYEDTDQAAVPCQVGFFSHSGLALAVMNPLHD